MTTQRSQVGDTAEDGASSAESLKTGRNGARSNLTAIAVVVLGIVSVGMLGWTDLLNRDADESFRQADAIMDLQIVAARSHIELEEGYHGGRPIRALQADAHLNHALSLCDGLLNGGGPENGRQVPALSAPRLRAQLQEIRRMLTEMQTIVRQHYREPASDGSSLFWDERYDDLHSGLLEHAQGVESSIETEQAQDQAESRRLFWGLILAWSCVFVASAGGLYSRERRRRAAESELMRANVHLQSQTEELRNHRERLAELVEERTRSLRAANVELRKEIDERREAEDALRSSEERYRVLVETMNEGMAIVDAEGLLTYVNDRFCALLGRTRGEMLARRCSDFARSEKDRLIIAGHLQALHRNPQERFEAAFATKDGHEIFTMVSPKAFYDSRGRMSGCFAVITDMTEITALQAKSLHAAHLASLGELAAGVAHEINNPANGIINYARMLRDRHAAGTEERDLAGRIQIEGRRIADIVRGLLVFARGGNREKRRVAVKEILSNSLDLTGSQLKRDGIVVQDAIPNDIPLLMADPQEMQRVFMNILSNARYALNQKWPGPAQEKIIRVHAERAPADGGHCVRITFHDTGAGIPAGLISRVKEPFFSTKPRGRGSGLGLSISNGIIDEHGGKLSLESVEGEYTRVVIDLPAGGE